MKKWISLAITGVILSSAALADKGPGEEGLGHKVPPISQAIVTYKSGFPGQILANGSNTFDILVWNMYKGENESWESDFKAISHDKDILITQEMYLEKKMPSVFKSHGKFEYVTATSFLWDGKIRTGVMTAANGQAVSKKVLRSRDTEPLIKTPKVVLVNKYRLNNDQTLLVANIHAINFVSTKKLMRQVGDAIEEIKKHDGPVIFAGDFNVWSDKKTEHVKEIMRKNGLIEVTFPKENDYRMKVFGHYLDYIFYKGLRLVKADVLGYINGADHKPMTATFSIE